MASFLNKENKIFNSNIIIFPTQQSKSGSPKVVPKKDNAPLGNGPIKQPHYKAEGLLSPHPRIPVGAPSK